MSAVAQDIMGKLTEIVRECLEKGRPFSGYNITKWTREREQLHLRHKEVAGAVHEMDIINDALDYGYTMADGVTYTWIRSTFTNWSGPPFEVYHPSGYDIKNFVPEGVQPASANEITASTRPANMIGLVTPTPDGNQPDAGGEQDDGTFNADYRNRLMVPTRFLKEAGLQPGDTVYVVPDPTNSIVLLAKDTDTIQTNGVKVTTQTVERNGDLRLSSRTLAAASLSGTGFVIEMSEKDVNGSKAKVVEVKAPANTK